MGGSLTGILAERMGRSERIFKNQFWSFSRKKNRNENIWLNANRKGALLFNNVFAIIGALLESFSKAANSYEMLIAGRIFIGINCGLNGGLAPMYLSEISPIHLRGAVRIMFYWDYSSIDFNLFIYLLF